MVLKMYIFLVVRSQECLMSLFTVVSLPSRAMEFAREIIFFTTDTSDSNLLMALKLKVLVTPSLDWSIEQSIACSVIHILNTGILGHLCKGTAAHYYYNAFIKYFNSILTRGTFWLVITDLNDLKKGKKTRGQCENAFERRVLTP